MTASGIEHSVDTRQITSECSVRMEKLLTLWLQDLETRNFPVSLKQIQEKARRLHEAIKETCSDLDKKCQKDKPFVASNGWFQNFRIRRGFTSINLKGESASADHAAAKVYPKEFQKIVSDGNYLPKQIWNFDETGFYYKSPPSRTYVKNINKTKKKGTKMLKDRATLLLGGNAEGHKMKPYLLYKAENPRCLKGIDKSTLPVTFRSNRKAWMTSASFKDWLVNFFIPFAKKYCSSQNISYKILLIIDNAPSHPDLSDIDPNIKIVFLPPNTTSLLQPMDMGVISIVKTNFKHLLLDIAIKTAAGNDMKFLEFLKLFSIRNAIMLFGKAWESVPKSAMTGVWSKLLKNEEDDESKALIDQKVTEIIVLGKDFGLPGMEAQEISESIAYQEDDLSIEELLELDNECEKESTESENIDVVNLEQNLKAEYVKKALLNISEACDLLAEHDPNQERFMAFQQGITTSIAAYKKFLKEKKMKIVQKNMDDFFSADEPL